MADDDDDAGRFSSPDPLTDDILEIAAPSSTRRAPMTATAGSRRRTLITNNANNSDFSAASKTTSARRSRGRMMPPPPPQPHPYLDGSERSSLPPQHFGSSSPMKGSAVSASGRRSPRKRTFELDVGDDRSPQRIFVTVEADGSMAEQAATVAAAAGGTTTTKRGVKRKLFMPPSSPTRGRGRSGSKGPAVVHGEEIETTSVPLRGLTDDEAGDNTNDNTATPRKRGRPRKSNGTPMPPKGRRRAGTPVAKKTTQQQRRRRVAQIEGSDLPVPGSEASMLSDVPTPAAAAEMDVDMDDDAGATPKPRAAKKPRTRKTPAKTGIGTDPVAPSSQTSTASRPTGRKRGRPRKALMPDELPPLTESEAERSLAQDAGTGRAFAAGPEQPSDGGDAPALPPARADVQQPTRGRYLPEADEEEDLLMLGSTPRRTGGTPTPGTQEGGERIQRSSEGRGGTSPRYHPTSEDAYFNEDGGYAPMMEQPSDDLESEDSGGGGRGAAWEPTQNRQDTLAQAADFSMIGLDSLQSFQASFQGGDLSRIPSEGALEQAEIGEETGLIINQTLESLRRSTQTEAQAEKEAPEQRHSSDNRYNEAESLVDVSRQAWPRELSRSPRRPGVQTQPRARPLSRQVFDPRTSMSKVPHVDDSFSTIPDSILQAATPRRVPMRRTSAAYDDSFSEVPEAILEAATPKPPARASAADRDEEDEEEHHSDARASATEQNPVPVERGSAARRASVGSNRLPTPDDTSSSNNGFRRTRGEEPTTTTNSGPSQAVAEASTAQGDVPSSPPAPDRSQTQVIDFGMSRMQQRDASGARGLQRSSPRTHQPPPQPQQSSSGGVAAAAVSSLADRAGHSLEPPAHKIRPSLSPIVRVARTLQSVISDRSSPEGRESNLGSPFRSSSLARSPSDHAPPHGVSTQRRNSHSNDLHAPSSSIHNPAASFGQQSWRRGSQGSVGDRRADNNPAVVGEIEDPFGPDIHGSAHMTSQRMSTHDGTTSGNNDYHDARNADATSSPSGAPHSDSQRGVDTSWAAAQNSGAGNASAGSRFLSVFGMRGTAARQAVDVARAEDSERTRVSIDDGRNDSESVDTDDARENFEQPEANRATEEREEGQESGDEDIGGITYHEPEDGDDDMDIWDFEASRPTPSKDDDNGTDNGTDNASGSGSASEERLPNIAQVVPRPRTSLSQSLEPTTVLDFVAAAVEPPRRNKIPSPWRRTRNSKRLIYKDEVLSPSQIEIEEGTVSEEVDDDGFEYEMVRPASRRASGVQQQTQSQGHGEYERQQSYARDHEAEMRAPEDLMEQEHMHEAEERQADDGYRDEGEDYHYDMMAQQSDGSSVAEEEEERQQELAQGQSEEHERSHESDEYSMVERQLLSETNGDDEYSLVGHSDRVEADVMDTGPEHEHPVDTTEVEEYSLVAQQRNRNNNSNQLNRPVTAQDKDKGKEQGETETASGKRKSRFFGGFDILSFFSSPAALPKTRAEEESQPTAAEKTTGSTREPLGRLAQPAASNANGNPFSKQPRQPANASANTGSLWSNGLFPSVQRKEFRPDPSPERRVDLFSPAPPTPAPRSDTVADTHEPSSEAQAERDLSPSGSLFPPDGLSSRSPSPSRPESLADPQPRSSAAPSTPEHQRDDSEDRDHNQSQDREEVYLPPIEQKRNFTPRLRSQSPGLPASSLFAPRASHMQNHQFLGTGTGTSASAAARSNTNNSSLNTRARNSEDNDNTPPPPQIPQLGFPPRFHIQQGRQPQSHSQQQQEQQEDSILTDGTEYERVPPREKPSQWDRTLSPSKSCFRSPLKPTTPGRVVAFQAGGSGSGSGRSGSMSPLSARMAHRQQQHQQSQRLLQPGPALPPRTGEQASGLSDGVRRGSSAESSTSQTHQGADRRTYAETQSDANARANSSSESLYPFLPPFPEQGQPEESAQGPDHSHSNRPAPTNISSAASSSAADPRTATAAPTQRNPTLAPGSTTFNIPLSTTTWTRDHWLRLEALADLRYYDPRRFRAEHFPVPHRHPDARRHRRYHGDEHPEDEASYYAELDDRFETHALRGKIVASQGASLILEAWHLEAVEAFRRELSGGDGGDAVPEWDDAVLAKRLFALLVGREWRRQKKEMEARRDMRIAGR